MTLRDLARRCLEETEPYTVVFGRTGRQINLSFLGAPYEEVVVEVIFWTGSSLEQAVVNADVSLMPEKASVIAWMLEDPLSLLSLAGGEGP